MLFALAGVVVRLAVLQVQDSDELHALGAEQRMRTQVLEASRGQILDRNGTPLAMTLEARDVYANPSLVTDPVGEARVLAAALDLKERQVRELLMSDGTFVYVKRQVDREVAGALAERSLPGIGFLPVMKRYYPAGPLASQVLGFVGVDGDGLSGLELQYETLLEGIPGERTVEVSAQGQQIAGGLETVSEPVAGGHLVLTIDRQIQFQAQQYLRMAVKENHAKGGTLIVMDPVTGDIYAMASYPWFDPNDFTAYPRRTWHNRAVTDTWEPGSVNKIITAAAAIETRAVSLTERFDVPATRKVGGFVIHDAHPHPITSMTLGDIIVNSSNIGSSLIADRVGNDALASYFARFGYGERTGVGFPGEAAGIVPQLGGWTDITRATASFGAGVAVTPLQMASVYATIANGGVLVQPRLVKGTVVEGVHRDADPSTSHRVLRSETARVLTQMLAHVVEEGTGENAQIAGYQVAGKTGTAKKLDENGNYTNRYVASFIGFLPASRPRVVVAAILDEPRTVYGGVAAAPLFQEVARYAIQRLGIEPAAPVHLPAHAITTS
jgi:cell division protein FtsI (penicillin-binding protein 3)